MKFNDNEIVKSCDLIERGLRITPNGINCCCGGGPESPILISAEEIANGRYSYDLLLSRRQTLFLALNGLNNQPLGGCAICPLVKNKKYSDVNFQYIGGLSNNDSKNSCFVIAPTFVCNMRCVYCGLNKTNHFIKSSYSVIEVIESFRSRGRALWSPNIELLGGEPTVVENFDDILNYLLDNKIGRIILTSNSLRYRQSVYDALAKNKIELLTSIDAGTPETFKCVRNSDSFYKVVDNLIRYKSSGTNNLVLKYIIGPWNMSEADLYGFVLLMCTLRPRTVIISLDSTAKSYPQSQVNFGARLYLLIRKYIKVNIVFFAYHYSHLKKYADYSNALRKEIDRLKQSAYYRDIVKLPDLVK